MKILWVSPQGDGWSLAYKLREAGNKVVLYNPKNKNGLGYLPSVTKAGWLDFAKKADLVVCDGVPESRHTRRSLAPSDLTNDLVQLNRAGIQVFGPVPTTELIHNDSRYRKKILSRHGLEYTSQPVPDSVGVTVSRDPDGRYFLVFRHRHLLGESNGPEVGNLGDLVFPVSPDQPLIKDSLGLFTSFLETIGYRGYLNLSLAVEENKLQVRDVTTGFLYPAVFVQFPSLLGLDSLVKAGAAISVVDLESDQGRERRVEGLLDYPGVFGAELHRKPEDGADWLHGEFAGAVVGIGNEWNTIEDNVNRKLQKVVRDNTGLGFRQGVGSSVVGHLKDLSSWGWLV